MRFNFEWDEQKARLNYQKHGVSFEEAVTVFTDPWAITITDSEHSDTEQRYIDIGMSDTRQVLVVVYTERGANIRLISCRHATLKERKHYEYGR
jgi:uncharacterized DUF497 family protein